MMGVLLVGAIATIVVVLDVLAAWHGFDSQKKFGALSLLAILVIGPIRFMRAEEKESREIGRAEVAMWGYMCLMVATIVFAR